MQSVHLDRHDFGSARELFAVYRCDSCGVEIERKRLGRGAINSASGNRRKTSRD